MLGFNVKRIFLRAVSTFHPSLASIRAVEGRGADALIFYCTIKSRNILVKK
jgi:hypothetical protein